MLLIIGYGNPLRGDDGIGPAVMDALENSPIAARAELLQRHQLGPELAEQVAAADAVIFVDASAVGTPGEIRTRKLQAPEVATSDLTHHVSPEVLLATARELYGRAPNAALVTVSGESFEVGAVMSDTACKAVHKAVSLVDSLADDLLRN
ncbi:MAG TPA: hydrogenase maturation protease [candidate division Zixibacteria bacterium]|nr:hydrogenase maturation protease [candidate division Zixibacteria bacterium]